MQFYVLIYVCYVCEDERTEEQERLRGAVQETGDKDA